MDTGVRQVGGPADASGRFTRLRRALDAPGRRARRRQADELLLAGVRVNAHSPLLSERAVELTSPRRRRSLARTVDGIARDLDGRVLPGPTPLNRPACRPHLDLIRALATRLRDQRLAVSPRGVLLVEDLLCNGYSSPLYVRERAGQVRPALRICLEALEQDGTAR